VLARAAILAMALRLSVCLSVCRRLSVTSRCSVETDERIELVRELPSTHAAISKTRGTCLWNFVPNSIKLCLQRDYVARLYQRQLMRVVHTKSTTLDVTTPDGRSIEVRHIWGEHNGFQSEMICSGITNALKSW